MIQEKTPQERAALHFKAAGLGDRSAEEAARLLFTTGMSFETAAVMGQRIGESCTATSASIREAADRYSKVRNGPRTTSAWGRPLAEAEKPTAAAPAPGRMSEDASPARKPARFVQPETRLVDGVQHHVVHEYHPVEQPTAQKKTTESATGKTNAWGRTSTEQKGA